jgi:hypothetical protein
MSMIQGKIIDVSDQVVYHHNPSDMWRGELTAQHVRQP